MWLVCIMKQLIVSDYKYVFWRWSVIPFEYVIFCITFCGSLNRKKKTFTLSESKYESQLGNLMKKNKHFLVFVWDKHPDFSSIFSLYKITSSEKELWEIEGIHLGSIVVPLNVGYRFSILVWEVLNERPWQILLKQKMLVNWLMHLKNHNFCCKQVKLRERVLKRWGCHFSVLSVYQLCSVNLFNVCKLH